MTNFSTAALFAVAVCLVSARGLSATVDVLTSNNNSISIISSSSSLVDPAPQALYHVLAEETVCRMYVDRCDLDVLVKKSAVACALSELKVTTQDERVFQVLSVSLCDPDSDQIDDDDGDDDDGDDDDGDNDNDDDDGDDEDSVADSAPTKKAVTVKAVSSAKTAECARIERTIVERNNLSEVYVAADYRLFHIVYRPSFAGKSAIIFEHVPTAAAAPAVPGETVSKPQAPLLKIRASVINKKRLVDLIFDVYVWIFATFISMLMGILIDKDSIIKIIKMPVPVLVGFFTQYICMPLLAFSYATLFKLPPAEALAIFIYGCSPGGSASNNWTILFDGDLDLSAVLTFVSTCASLFVLPAWVYTLGRVFSVEADIQIPMFRIFANLFITIGPCLVGFAINMFAPKVRIFVKRIAKPFMFVVLFSFFVLVIVTKIRSYMFIRWQHWLAGPLIPWIGYFIGGFFAFILRLPFKQIKTIAIETGIQNVGVAFLIVITNFPQPEVELAILPLMAVAMTTIIPLYIVFFTLKIVRCCRAGKDKKEKNGADVEVGDEKEEKNPEEMKMLGQEANGKK